jgi:acetyl-CoA C-acetyltransferase
MSGHTADDLTPVLVGVGDCTVKDEPLDAVSSPLDLMLRAASGAADDAGLAFSALAKLDELAVVKSFREPMRNTPDVLAARLGASHARQWLTPDGGNAPQYLVNRYAHAISQGEASFVALTGAEAMDNGRRLIKSGVKPDWRVASDEDAQLLFPDREMCTAHEKAHGVWIASLVYPLFENALRGHYGHTIAEHQKAMGELFEPFSTVAERTPGAWFPTARSADEIATPTSSNRYVGWPYTKFMNAMNQVNQSAFVLLCSVARAKAMGIDPSKWVYLHGCADTTERWYMSDRTNYFSSKAIRVLGEQALGMAGKSIEEIAHLDLYSCFPSAVAIARDELGIKADDPRELTVTGGLPFHGGAGNNYVMNAIVHMVKRVREDAGSFGMVTANGGYLSKHAAGIYSTQPYGDDAPWARQEPNDYQIEVDSVAAPSFEEHPQGEACVETYTVAYGRDGEPSQGIVVGRLGSEVSAAAPRFLANVPADKAVLSAMVEEEFLGCHGRVLFDGTLNRFDPS